MSKNLFFRINGQTNPPMGKRIVSPKTSNLMKMLIQLNVTEGTKKFVEVQGSRT